MCRVNSRIKDSERMGVRQNQKRQGRFTVVTRTYQVDFEQQVGLRGVSEEKGHWEKKRVAGHLSLVLITWTPLIFQPQG